jgi:hypothetical protein
MFKILFFGYVLAVGPIYVILHQNSKKTATALQVPKAPPSAYACNGSKREDGDSFWGDGGTRCIQNLKEAVAGFLTIFTRSSNWATKRPSNICMARLPWC